MADTAETGPSPEAFERIKTERDQLKAQVQELSTTVRDAGLFQKASDIFAEKFPQASAADVRWASEVALPHLRTVKELDEITGLIDNKFSRLLTAPPAPDSRPAGNENERTPDVDLSPAPGFAGPSPGGDAGPAPQLEKMTIRSPEVQAAINANNTAQIEQWDKEGRLDWRSAPFVPAGPQR